MYIKIINLFLFKLFTHGIRILAFHNPLKLKLKDNIEKYKINRIKLLFKEIKINKK